MEIVFYILLIATAIVFLYQELKSKRRLWLLNILVKIIILVSLYALYNQEYNESSDSTAVLLTPHYSAKTLDSIKSVYPEIEVFYSHNRLPLNYKEVFILGEGLPGDELSLLKKKELHFMRPDRISGVGEIQLTQEVYEGEEVMLAASYIGKDTTLALSFSNRQDTIDIDEAWKSNFSASTPGHYLATLGDIALPYQVKELKKLKILIRTSQPDFRTRFLKNHLRDEDHLVNWRTSISKDIDFTDNTQSTDFGLRLTDDNLNVIDLLILDDKAYEELNGVDRQNIIRAVEGGLGMLLLPTSDNYGSILQKVIGVGVTLQDEAISEQDDLNLLNLSINPNPVIVDQENDFRSFYTYRGKGKIGGLSSLNDFYYQLIGRDSLYSKNYRDLIYAVARTDAQEYRISWEKTVNLVNQPFNFIISTQVEKPTIYIDEIVIPLRQDLYWGNRWHGLYWPQDTGWHQVATATETLASFYVQEQSKLASPDRELIALNKAYAKTELPLTDKTLLSDYSKWIIIFVLILCFGYLWIETKL